MAIDTKNKRASSLGRVGLFWLGPDPDNATSNTDRGQALGLYGGISADAPTSVSNVILVAYTEEIVDQLSWTEVVQDQVSYTEEIVDQLSWEDTIP